MEKIMKISTIVFAVIGIIAVLIAAAGVVYAGMTKKATISDRNYGNRDTDKDGIRDADDTDVDGDGLQNMEDEDADGDGVPNVKDALQAAQKLLGRPYDQLNDVKNSVLSQMGAIVCTDVVVYAYEKAGIYLGLEMRELYKKKPKIFYGYRWNNPTDDNFARRMRNLRVYCKYGDFMLKDGEPLQPGDIIMFSQGHIALIEKVKGGDFTTIESSSKKIFTTRTTKDDIMKRSFEKYGEEVAFARLNFEKKKGK